MRRKLILVALMLLVACGQTEAERIESSCNDWARAACSKNQECAGIDGTVEECAAGVAANCIRDANLKGETCRANKLEALERCTPDLEALTCEMYCGNDSFCYFPCPYFCPEE